MTARPTPETPRTVEAIAESLRMDPATSKWGQGYNEALEDLRDAIEAEAASPASAEPPDRDALMPGHVHGIGLVDLSGRCPGCRADFQRAAQPEPPYRDDLDVVAITHPSYMDEEPEPPPEAALDVERLARTFHAWDCDVMDLRRVSWDELQGDFEKDLDRSIHERQAKNFMALYARLSQPAERQ